MKERKNIMSREQAKQFLISLGIEEPSDDAISSYLNSISSEVGKEKDRAEKLKEEQNKVKDLQAKLDELNKQNMSEIERANADKLDAENKLAELQLEIGRMKLKNSFAEQGIIGEDADKLIESMKDGAIDVTLLGQIINAKQKEAVDNKIAELSKQTIQPNGGSIEDKDKKTDADKVVDSISQSLKDAESTQAVIDAYK